ncbi:hypothetical protein BDGGKGIB_01010 [Nodularia sphaerocarpa UHCC 0038]|nr:hypothetical protein BDGGKGIB_01010 [Nodularia sphaerocarpa UHCC 0038]
MYRFCRLTEENPTPNPLPACEETLSYFDLFQFYLWVKFVF